MSASYEDGFFTTTYGLRLHYRDYPGSPERPPLLCLHGLTRNARDFADFAERQTPRFRVIALDFRGRGGSDYDAQPHRYTPPTYAADVLGLLDHLQIDRAIFVGTSLGGLVTMAVAVIAPQRIAASILNDVGPELDRAGLDRIRGYLGDARRFASWEAAAQAIAAHNNHIPAHYGEDDWVIMAHRVCREIDGGIGFDYDMAIAVPFQRGGASPTIDLWPLFKALGQKPLLVLRGEHSDLLSAASLEQMHEAVPDMKSVTVQGVGHAPMLDEPEAVAAIDEFLDALPEG